MTEVQVQQSQSPPAQYGPAETNGLAVASLVCGILGVVFPFIPLIPSILAVVFAGAVSDRSIAPAACRRVEAWP